MESPPPSTSARALLRRLFLSLFCFSLLSLWSCAYKVEIVQGSIIDAEEISQLQLGMNKAQVEYILGTPSIINVLNENRWDYIYRVKRGRKVVEKKGYLLFNEGQLILISIEEFL